MTHLSPGASWIAWIYSILLVNSWRIPRLQSNFLTSQTRFRPQTNLLFAKWRCGFEWGKGKIRRVIGKLCIEKQPAGWVKVEWWLVFLVWMLRYQRIWTRFEIVGDQMLSWTKSFISLILNALNTLYSFNS